MLVLCINSFNSWRYMEACCALVAAVNETADLPPCVIFVGIGGCDRGRLFTVKHGPNTLCVATVTQNLSDHNIFPAYAQACRLGHAWPDATFVLLHDTCILAPSFAARMRQLASQHLPEFVFAHTYGLYNMGVCTHDFMLRRYADWKPVRTLSKDQGIRLEQGANVVVEGHVVPSLHSYSCHTLAQSGTPGDIDTFSVQRSMLHGQPRFVSFVAALGIYKPFASISSFAVPVFAAHRPATASERTQILRDVSPRLSSNWAPMLALHDSI